MKRIYFQLTNREVRVQERKRGKKNRYLDRKCNDTLSIIYFFSFNRFFFFQSFLLFFLFDFFTFSFFISYPIFFLFLSFYFFLFCLSFSQFNIFLFSSNARKNNRAKGMAQQTAVGSRENGDNLSSMDDRRTIGQSIPPPPQRHKLFIFLSISTALWG
ncbi:unnamed protein product [Acanthosepion pharaonis]|uniref:Transmembrane protein n=1 Tax=Acanthosepion pharaonis TaxID=158019 RepID=A0A812CP02_ACAPH|nr:unnamed protein product [Sepia pharaonis]